MENKRESTVIKVNSSNYFIFPQIMNVAENKHEGVVAAVEELAKAVKISFESHWLDPITNLLGVLVGGRLSCYKPMFVPDFAKSVRILLAEQ